ncbi:AraC family transcriptional regulator [Paraburkholderia sp. UYCP14C]|uniref:AraC family transcriptional regulator n=1 Tax=Paraburkholderia sp. UYCP14C TaxID=2511130 RepID=UPI001021F9DE|nr:AraC family transcriptional regulator [Paraburkholderia sp. UYCP14C]RZF23948.1 AraC family transcriptional regulator [Paraburkholderia sp. UYCP14C]
MDPLSDVLSLLKVKSVLSARFEAAGPWALRFPRYRHVKFGGVIKGARWIWIEGVTQPAKMQEGDFCLLTDGSPYCFASEPGVELQDGEKVFASQLDADGIVRYGTGKMRTISVGGQFEFDGDMSGLLLNFLPPLVHISADSPDARSLSAALELIRAETESVRPGAAAMAGSIANIVLVNILRAHLAASPRSAGWLGALSDPRIGSALGMVHGEIARRWKVEELASKVGMSRTAFIERFKELVGLPPLEYLIRWRMTIARDALKTGNDNLSVIAAAVGYTSETTFSSTFKRVFGQSPSRYRSEARNRLE